MNEMYIDCYDIGWFSAFDFIYRFDRVNIYYIFSVLSYLLGREFILLISFNEDIRFC